ncbi:hypothetical protein P5G51_012530 [Virgibacillus sp. 179-BFC.A HS]|uniref:Uncharacterized protein n=1 Tax=Tigheibacillus jepli TaxID=3035914 RepID=A0ABU5CJX6_9BACI|nr:hypothetical protein [Virgibacillus sp. 179-BFC.A HS]MDY0406109.1 hypothetical protein [Virgibacillus sp. 179-BFC.A HS]
MYQLKEISLKNGQTERKVLVIEFDDPQMAVIAEFLMADASLLHGEIVSNFDQVLTGQKNHIHTNGNRCGLEIGRKTTHVYDLLEGDGIDSYPDKEIDTKTLRDLTVMWLEKLQKFRDREHQ